MVVEGDAFGVVVRLDVLGAEGLVPEGARGVGDEVADPKAEGEGVLVGDGRWKVDTHLDLMV